MCPVSEGIFHWDNVPSESQSSLPFFFHVFFDQHLYLHMSQKNPKTKFFLQRFTKLLYFELILLCCDTVGKDEADGAMQSSDLLSPAVF